MAAILLAIPILGLAAMLQVAVFSRIMLLAGCADLLLVIIAAWSLQERVRSTWYWAAFAGLLMAVVSGLPWFVSLAGYLLTAALGRYVIRRVWQAPLLAMFLVTFLATILFQAMSLLVLILMGTPFPLVESFTSIILPSILLNLLLAIPLHASMRDLANQLYPGDDLE